MFKKMVLTLMIVLMAVSVSTARELEGVTMPETLPVGNDVLGLNGIGLRNLMVIKVYVAGLYLKSASTDPAAIINADEPMIMRLQMLRDTKPKTMNQALYNGMRNSVGAGFSQIADRVDKFKAMIYDPLVAGDVFNFIYKPGTGLEVYKGKQFRGTVPGLDFKKAFFGIWLNATKPADEGLKAGLISGKFTTELAGIMEKKKQEAESMAAAEAKAKAEAQAKVEAEKTAATAKAAEEAKLAAVTEKAKTEKAKMGKEAKAAKAAVAAAGTKTTAEAAKQVAEVKKAEKSVEKTAAGTKAAEEAKLAAVTEKAKTGKAKMGKEAKAAGTKTTAEAAKQVAEVKKAETSVEKAAVSTKEGAEMANVEAYASADQFAADDVYFKVNSTTLSAAAKKNLTKKVKYLKSNPGAAVVLEPVCDSKGSKEINLKLANKRGDSVRNFIIGAGIDGSRIETMAVRQVDATAPYVNNRRVHLSIK